MADATTAMPVENHLPEAGPSRSPLRRSSIPPPPSDIVMEESAATSNDLQSNSVLEHESIKKSNPDDVALLLNISSTVAVTKPPDPSKPIVDGQISPKTSTFPYTPPEDPIPPPTIPPAPSTLSSLLDTVSLVRSPSPENRSKGKRKKTSHAGSSRQGDSEKPPHYLGEDNTLIRCICGITEDDGFTIQCEKCGAWEHGICFGYLDADAAPDQYYCELCDPRPVDPEAARLRQRDARIAEDHRRAMALMARPSLDTAKSKGGKGKKRHRQSTANTDGEADIGDGLKDPSPSAQSVKPKRRVANNKPRSKPSAQEATPGPTSTPAFKEPLPPVDLDEDYFNNEPWSMEYTPVESNVVRGVAPKRILSEFYHEWVDADSEEASRKTITHPSGLPSPTETGELRLSPDHLFPPIDFDVLAPPVPPVRLSGNLDDMAAPTHVELIEDTQSFLPLNYAEVASAGVYSRPAVYGVFADKALSTGTLIGEYRGEIVDCRTYRQDPVNQYAGLGITKPYVRSLPPPVNLIIDSRGYGSEMRFVRSSCHPNAVLRPVLVQGSKRDNTQIRFGIFACRSIHRDEEITLAWEWDDQHVVHSLRTAVLTTLAPERDFGLTSGDLQTITTKCDAVLTHLLGTFTSCACVSAASCAIAQMRLLVEGKDPEVELNERGKAKVDFGRLVGAVRGWRRREMEVREAKQWTLPGALQRRFIPSPPTSVGRSEPRQTPRVSIDDDTTMRDDEDDETEDETPVNRQQTQANPDVEMKTPISSPVVSKANPLSSSLSSAPSVTPRARSPVLSDAANESDEDDGHVSDATTITLPKTEFSEAEDPSPIKPKAKTPGRKVKRVGGKPGRKPKSKPRTPSNVSSRPSPPFSEPISTPSTSPVMLASRLFPESPKQKDTVVEWVDGYGFKTGVESPRTPRVVDITLPRTVQPRVDVPVSLSGAVEKPDEDMTAGQVDEVVPEPVREPTPKEPTPPREPTPEPPKKVSLADYLKTRKAKQDVPGAETPSTDSESAPVLPAAPAEIKEETMESEVTGPASSTEMTTEAENARLNLNEFLPSSRTSSVTPGTPAAIANGLPSESPRQTPIATPSYVPRQEYFPRQPPPGPSSSFTPRAASSSFVPRATTLPSEEATPPFGAQRQLETSPVSSFVPRNETMIVTPPHPPANLPDHTAPLGMPPVLAHRDAPPHMRAPPTGPKVPPTGPRGSYPPPSPSSRPLELGGSRGGFTAPRGGFAPRGGGFNRPGDRFDDRGGFGFRGRGGGFRGRGRGA